MKQWQRWAVVCVCLEVAGAGAALAVARAADGGARPPVAASGQKKVVGGAAVTAPGGGQNEGGGSGGAEGLLQVVVSALLSGGGLLGAGGAAWKWWLKKRLEERAKGRAEQAEAAAKVNKLLPELHAEVRAARAEQGADLEVRAQAIMRMGPDGKCVSVNKAWRRLTGVGSEEATGTQWLARVHAADRERVKRGWAAAFEDGKSYEQAFRLEDPGGEETPVECRGAPARTTDGAVIGWLVSMRVMSPQEWAEDQKEEVWRNATPDPEKGVRDTRRARRENRE